MIIRQITTNDSFAYTDHFIRHVGETGIGGILVNPYPTTHQWNESEFRSNLLKKWTLVPFSPNFETAWVAEVDGKIIGHLDLRCGGIEAQKHRMRLGLGIENDYRSKGLGQELMRTALLWASQQYEISWIDLSVFSENIVARKLYERFGFKYLYKIEDALRVEGKSIDDIQMTLKLRES